MQPDIEDQPKAVRWAMPVSLAVHLSVLALLIFGLPTFDFSQPQEQAVKVALVPPLEPPAPKPPAEEPPPPAPQPASPAEQKPAPEPAPKKAEPQPQPEQPAPPRPAVMQPVVEFGEKDSGPKTSDGDASEAAAEEPAEQAAAEEQAPPAEPKPLDSGPGEPKVEMVEPERAEAEKPARDKAKPAATPRLAKARTLFSRAITDDPVARTAIGKIPRDRRGGTLCGTELREQLVRGSPPYFPELLPSVLLKKGNVIDVKAAFNASGVWRAVAFRCEVDRDAMKVVAFSLAVGDLIPRSEWKRLGLPSQ